MAADAASTFVSARTNRLGSRAPSRDARNRTCLADSSPDTYKTRDPPEATRAATCSKSVDLPMPGSPPMSMSAPGTIPPPKTRSNSLMPPVRRGASSGFTSARLTGTETRRLEPASWSPAKVAQVSPNAPPPLRDALPEDQRGEGLSTRAVSTSVFHAPHAGHCPSHLAASCAHC